MQDSNGRRERLQKPDVVYIGLRSRAVQSVNTFTFGTNTAGTVKITVNPAKYLYSESAPAGALAEVTVTADGVLTTTQLATAAAAALNALPDFSAHFLASSALGVVTVTSDVEGYPLILFIRSSSPGPTMTQVVTTANTPGDYALDLDDIQAAAEYGNLLDFPSRRFYWITDLQGDDEVNAEGMEWAEDEEDNNTPPRDYQFVSWSTSGARRIQNGGGDYLGNFDPTSTASAAATANAANGGTGWTRGSVNDHDRFEFFVPALLGRTIAYLPGEVSFTSKVLQGGTTPSKMSPRDFGDDETLTDDRKFNWYSAEGPGALGSAKWGYLSDGSFMDRKWLEDYVEYIVRIRLLAWMQLKNIVTYTDDDIAAGAAIIKAAIAEIPAVLPDTIGVTYLGRDQVNPANIVARIYYDYEGSGTSGGIINKIGTPSSPIQIVISDGA